MPRLAPRADKNLSQTFEFPYLPAANCERREPPASRVVRRGPRPESIESQRHGPKEPSGKSRVGGISSDQLLLNITEVVSNRGSLFTEQLLACQFRMERSKNVAVRIHRDRSESYRQLIQPLSNEIEQPRHLRVVMKLLMEQR